MMRELTTSLLKPMLALAGLLCLFWTAPSLAEQKQVFGDYEIHYNVFNSTFIKPEIARQYEINRSRAIGLVNIAVLKKSPKGGLPTPVAVPIEGEVTNMLQQRTRLAFRRITEGQAIYYLAEFHISPNDPLVFNIRVLADPNQPPLALRFSKVLYPD